jgi:flagellar protein FlaH
VVEVYEIEIERDGLHRNLGGGFPKGSIVVLIGDHGAGKSAICQRIAYGLLRNQHSCTMISTEFTTKGFIDQMKSMNYNIVDYLLNRELLYIPVYPLIGKPRGREDFLGRLMRSKQLYERDLVFIDTFSALIKNDIDMERAISVLGFFKKLAGMSKTIVLTMESGELPEEVIAPFKSDSDVFLDIKMRTLEGQTTRTMVVNRYTSSAAPVVEATGFRIEPKVGFIIDITTVA